MFHKDMKPADWLEWFVGAKDSIRPEPFQIKDGERGATDCRHLAISCDDLPCPQPTNDNIARKVSIAKNCLTILDGDIIHTQKFSREYLADFFGECIHPCKDVCGNCNGLKKVHHDCNCDLCDEDYEECPDCDGTGIAEKPPSATPILVYGIPFDANRIAYCLEHMPPSDSLGVLLVKRQDGKTHHLGLLAEKFRCVVVNRVLEKGDTPTRDLKNLEPTQPSLEVSGTPAVPQP